MLRENVRGGEAVPKSNNDDEDGDGERRRLLSTIEGIPAAGYYTSQPMLPYLEHLVSTTYMNRPFGIIDPCNCCLMHSLHQHHRNSLSFLAYHLNNTLIAGGTPKLPIITVWNFEHGPHHHPGWYK
jgi:hypothetical protein